jgi:hypothetical protein
MDARQRREMIGLVVVDQAKRRKRIVLSVQMTVLMLATFAAPIVHYVREQGHVTVTASSSYAPEYDAEMAYDGVLETEWCLPDQALGFIEFSFASSRRVNSLDITNGHNTTYQDRAIKKARILVYNGDKVVEKHHLELPGIEPVHKRRRVTLGGHRATRVKIEVLEFDGNGAALSEVAIY